MVLPVIADPTDNQFRSIIRGSTTAAMAPAPKLARHGSFRAQSRHATASRAGCRVTIVVPETS